MQLWNCAGMLRRGSPRAAMKRSGSKDSLEALDVTGIDLLENTGLLKRQKPEDQASAGAALPTFVWSRRGSFGGTTSDDSAGMPHSTSCPDLEFIAAETKREMRLAKNREAARLRRLRKRSRVETLSAKVQDLEDVLAILENHSWESEGGEKVSEASGYDINRDVHIQWHGSPVDRGYYAAMQLQARRALAAQQASHTTIMVAHEDNEALVALARARLYGTDNPALVEGLAALGMTEEQVWSRRSFACLHNPQCRSGEMQAHAILLLEGQVSSLRGGLDGVSAVVAGVVRSTEPVVDCTVPGPPVSRRGSRSSFSSLDSAASDRPRPDASLLHFPIVDVLCKKFQTCGAPAEQLAAFYAFSCQNGRSIAGLPLPTEGRGTTKVSSSGGGALFNPHPAIVPPTALVVPVTPPRTPVAAIAPPTALVVPVTPPRTPVGVPTAPDVPGLSTPTRVQVPPVSPALHTSMSEVFSELDVGLSTPPPEELEH